MITNLWGWYMTDNTTVVDVLLVDYTRYSIFERGIFKIHEIFDPLEQSYRYAVSRYRAFRRWYIFGDYVCRDLEEFVVYYSYDDLIHRLPWRDRLHPLYNYLTDNELIPNFIRQYSSFRR